MFLCVALCISLHIFALCILCWNTRSIGGHRWASVACRARQPRPPRPLEIQPNDQEASCPWRCAMCWSQCDVLLQSKVSKKTVETCWNVLKRTEKCCLKRQLAENAFVFQNAWLADGRTSGVITGATNLNTTCKRWRTSVLEETILTCRLPAKVWKKRQKLIREKPLVSYLGRQNSALLGWTTDFCHFDSHWIPAALSLKKVHTQRKTLKRFRSHNETGRELVMNWSLNASSKGAAATTQVPTRSARVDLGRGLSGRLKATRRFELQWTLQHFATFCNNLNMTPMTVWSKNWQL